jgi:hypothetical protein
MNPFDEIYIGAALEGRYDPLAEHIKRGGEITPAMRQLLAQVLLGERKLPKCRPVRNKTVDRKIKMARSVVLLEREGAGTEAAVNFIAENWKVNPRTVWRALERGRFVVEYEMDENAEDKALQEAIRQERRNQPHLLQQYYHPHYSSLEMVEFYLQWQAREVEARSRRARDAEAREQRGNPDKK